MRTRAAWLSLLLLVLVATGGCAGGLVGHGPHKVASGLVEQASERAGWTMEGSPRGAPTMSLVQRLRGGDRLGVASIDVLSFDGTGFDGHVVLRLARTIDGGEFDGDVTVVRCYSYRLTLEKGVERRHLRRCPAAPALDIPPAPVPPSLPTDAEARLRQVCFPTSRGPERLISRLH